MLVYTTFVVFSSSLNVGKEEDEALQPFNLAWYVVLLLPYAKMVIVMIHVTAIVLERKSMFSVVSVSCVFLLVLLLVLCQELISFSNTTYASVYHFDRMHFFLRDCFVLTTQWRPFICQGRSLFLTR